MNPGGGRSSVFLRDASSALPPKVNIAPIVRSSSVPSLPTCTRGSGLTPSVLPRAPVPLTYDRLALVIESGFWKEDPRCMSWIRQGIKNLKASGQPVRLYGPFTGPTSFEWLEAEKAFKRTQKVHLIISML
ncbi:MAG: hypothetical protein GY696_18700 [Gammaproteobacteria bacterium]|nr:hypothetical protein [Gammaproteobacteria bacterium]